MARRTSLVCMGIVAGALALTLAGCGGSAGGNAPADATDQTQDAAVAGEEAAPEAETGVWVMVEGTTHSEGSPDSTYTNTIDEQGNVVERIYSSGDGSEESTGSKTTYELDEYGWIVKTVSEQPSGMDDEMLVWTSNNEHEYDDQGRVTHRITREGDSEEASYTQEITYGPLGNVATLTSYEGVDTLDSVSTYDDEGRLVRREMEGHEARGVAPATDPQTIEISYTFDEEGHVATSTATWDRGLSVDNEYTCDEHGNVIARTMTVHPVEGEERVVTFEYRYEYVENPSPAARVQANEFTMPIQLSQ